MASAIKARPQTAVKNENNAAATATTTTTATTAPKISLVDQLGGRAPLHSGALPPNSVAPQKVTVLANPAEDLATFSIYNEDHTLGNAIRYLLSRDSRVHVAGYSNPHPSEHKINLRIQTYNQLPASAVLRENLQHLEHIADHITHTFNQAESKYRSKQAAATAAK